MSGIWMQSRNWNSTTAVQLLNLEGGCDDWWLQSRNWTTAVQLLIPRGADFLVKKMILTNCSPTLDYSHFPPPHPGSELDCRNPVCLPRGLPFPVTTCASPHTCYHNYFIQVPFPDPFNLLCFISWVYLHMQMKSQWSIDLAIVGTNFVPVLQAIFVN